MFSYLKEKRGILIPLIFLFAFVIVTPQVQKRISFSPETLTAQVAGTTQCNDGIDNDGDGLIDTYDPSGAGGGDTGCSWGGDNSESVGVPTGTTLTTYTGPSNITVDGTTISGKIINTNLRINANNVTIKNSVVNSTYYYPVWWESGAGGLIEDSEINGGSGSSHGDRCITGGATVRRVDVHGCGDGIGASSGALITNNYFHDPDNGAGVHGDGLDLDGDDNLTITENIVDGDYTSSAVGFITYSGTMNNNSFDRNYVRQRSTSNGYLFYLHANDNIMDGVRVRYNRFRPPTNYIYEHAIGDPTHVTWTGNKYTNGTDANYTASGQVMACANSVDDDDDGLTDLADPGCSNAGDNSEDNSGTSDTISPAASVVELSGTVTASALTSLINAKPAGPVTVTLAAGKTATVTGDFDLPRASVTISNVTFTDTITFKVASNSSRLLNSRAKGFYIMGADDIVLQGNYFDGLGQITQNLIWDSPKGSFPERFVIENNTFTRFWG